MIKKILIHLILFMLIFTTLAAAQNISLQDPWYSKKEQGKHGGTLISTLTGDPKTFNILIAKETSSTDVLAGYIFEGLLTRNGVTTEIEPELAKEWSISEDGKIYTLKLRRGIQWSDGVEFTADDVIFTFDLISDQQIPTSSRDVMLIDGEFPKYKKLDKYTVQFKLAKSFAPFLNNLTAPILPKHKLYSIWQAGNFNKVWGINTEPAEIVGTGPFKLKEYKPGERIIMVKNNLYWRKDPAGKTLPYLENWVRIIADNQETKSLLFEKGQTHFLAVRGIDYKRFVSKADQNDFNLVNAGPNFGTDFLIFNLNPRNPKLKEQPWKLEWFNNIHFRKAIAYAFDKQTMINQALAGQGTPQWSPISSPNKVYLNQDVKKYPFNLEKARQELKAAKFYWDDSGKLYDQNDRRVEFNILTYAENNTIISLMNIIASDLRNLGMKINASPIEFNKLVSKLDNEWDFDTIIIGLTGGVEPHSGSNVWPSNGHLHMWNPRQKNPATEWEARIDELFRLGAAATSIKQRQKYYDEFQEIIAEKLPVIYTVVPNSIYAVRNNLKNTDITAYGGVIWNIYELYLED